MQAALDLAASGIKVYLTDRRASIGGVMSQLDKTFPTNDCAMCTMAPRLVEIGRHRDIEILTLSEVAHVQGQPGDFTVTVKRQPSFVNESKCTGCGSCVSNCPTRNHAQPLEIPRVELEPSYRETVGNILARHKNQEGPLMPILQEVNAALNYFPQSVLAVHLAGNRLSPLAHLQNRDLLQRLQRRAQRAIRHQCLHGNHLLCARQRAADGESSARRWPSSRTRRRPT